MIVEVYMGQMAKRVFLFIAVNFLVIMTISFALSLFNVQPYLTRNGIDYQSLLIFCFIWGMGGAFISLALSRIIAKWMMGIRLIDPAKATGDEKALYAMVEKLAKSAGLPCTPEVGYYKSQEVNAFATGPTSSRALVAVSSGLLNRMDSAQVEGVLAHEITHIANGDMVTMTLLQGVINAFVMFFARILSYILVRAIRQKDDSSVSDSPILYSVFVFAFEIVFMILGSLVVAAFSRYREYRADAGGARLAGRDKMIDALKALQKTLEIKDPRADQPAFRAMKISEPKGFLSMFASHPPLESRIQRLQQGRF